MKFLAPDNVNSVSVNGATYPVKDGIAVLPDGLSQRSIEDLLGHGLEQLPAGEDVEDAKKRVSADRMERSEKAEIAEKAMRLFGVNLDRRRSLAAMQLEYDQIAKRASELSAQSR